MTLFPKIIQSSSKRVTMSSPVPHCVVGDCVKVLIYISYCSTIFGKYISHVIVTCTLVHIFCILMYNIGEFILNIFFLNNTTFKLTEMSQLILLIINYYFYLINCYTYKNIITKQSSIFIINPIQTRNLNLYPFFHPVIASIYYSIRSNNFYYYKNIQYPIFFLNNTKKK